MKTITLEGTLTRDAQIRETRPRSYTALRFHPLAGKKVEQEVFVPATDYVVLRMKARTRVGGVRKLRSYRLVLWNADYIRDRRVRIAREGSRVRITGTPEIARFEGKEGEPVELRQIVLQSYEVLQAGPAKVQYA